jgi:hypothetical protein
MPLGPLRATCVQPAPKSRFVVSGLLRYEDQDQKRHPGYGAGCQALRPSRNGLTAGLRTIESPKGFVVNEPDKMSSAQNE